MHHTHFVYYLFGHICSVGGTSISTVSLRLLFCCNSLALDLVVLGLCCLDLISLLFQITGCSLIKQLVLVIVAIVPTSRNSWLTTITCIVSMCHARNWSDSHILVKEFRCCEICKDFSVVHAIVIFFLLFKPVKLSHDHCVHALEHIDEIFRLLLE